MSDNARIRSEDSPTNNPESCRGLQYGSIWERAADQFQQAFAENEVGHKCDVCDRLRFVRDLKAIDSGMPSSLAGYFPGENTLRLDSCADCL